MGAEPLRQRLGRLIDGWDYDYARFEISDFISWVAERRSRSIRLVPMSLPAELFGAWIEGERVDYVFYEAEPLHVHTVHILLHELSHILLGHQTAQVAGEVDGPTLNTDRVETSPALAALFRKTSHTDEQEVEAEMLSSLIQQRVYRQAGLAALSHVGRGIEMQRFMQGLGIDAAS